MRLLQLHSDFIEYQAVEKEADVADAASKDKIRLEELVVLFLTVEKDDDEETGKKAIEEIKLSLEKINVTRILLYPYSHLSSYLASPQRAIKICDEMAQYAKHLGLEVYKSPFGWTKSFNIKVKGHPLAEQSKTINVEVRHEQPSEALKAEEKLISKWFILDTQGKLLPEQEFDYSEHRHLEKLAKYEISKVRAVRQIPPHVTLMKKLGIADYEIGSDSGNMRFYPKGRLIKSLLEQFVTQRVKEYGGMEVETPIMYDPKHPALASYLSRFPARQYIVKSEDKDLFLRFSACFGQFLMAKDMRFSYKQLPLRIYELTRYSFRREKSGEIVGLRRLRAFTMPDCHALCSNLDQAKDEFIERLKLSVRVLEDIGFEKDDYEMAIRFTKQFYEENKDFIHLLVQIFGKPALVEIWEERFFYFVLKWEFNFIDNLDKASALSTDQIDIENGERYGITFVDENGDGKHPIILHNSPSGAIERDIYGLLERAYARQTAGGVPALPFWLNPVQVRFIPISEKYLALANNLAQIFTEAMIRADIDDRDETVQKRVREAEKEWVSYIIVVGEEEEKTGLLNVRGREERKITKLKIEEILEEIRKKASGKPFLPLPLPKMLSKRPKLLG